MQVEPRARIPTQHYEQREQLGHNDVRRLSDDRHGAAVVQAPCRAATRLRDTLALPTGSVTDKVSRT